MKTSAAAPIVAVLLSAFFNSAPSVYASELIEAVKASDLTRVQLLLSHGAKVNEADAWGTPLHIATVRGDVNVVGVLIDAGADLEAQTETDKQRPLHIAVFSQNQAMVELLLSRGATLDVYNSRGDTPLILAARSGNVEIARALLKAGADPQAENSLFHEPALLCAVSNGHVEMTELLLEKGADINSKHGTQANTALHWAARNARGNMVKLLATHGADLNATNSEGKTPLQQTTAPDIQQLLLGLGAKR